MTIANIIEREHLARKAPRPVTWSWYATDKNRPWDSFDPYFFFHGDEVNIRMSDGSLVIVKRKNR